MLDFIIYQLFSWKLSFCAPFSFFLLLWPSRLTFIPFQQDIVASELGLNFFLSIQWVYTEGLVKAQTLSSDYTMNTSFHFPV